MVGVTNGVADQLDPGQMNRRIAELERQVRELRAARRAEATTISAGGLTITAQGGLNVIDDFNNLLLALGAITNIPFSGGITQYGFQLTRQNPDGTAGELALSLAASGATPPQTLGLYDSSGNTLWSDDGLSGQGIALPYLSFAMVPYVGSLWPSTNAGSWSLLSYGTPPKQQPKVMFAGIATVPSGVTGQLRIFDIVNNVQIGSTVTISSAPGGASWQIGPAAVGGYHTEIMGLELQGQITAGSGSIAAAITASFGCQS